jgi:mannosylglycerate hydrolase
MSSEDSKKTAIVVSHTHWDRAWYLTFQQFRHRMVRMIDRLIGMLDQYPDYHSFTLDGQTILLEDYLEIRPHRKTDLIRLISSGKMIVGPWYILPDLFLVSGESVIRNLQIGLKTSREYGSPMQVGYVPDPFGHFAQLPQILNGFGIDTFIFMRGLGSEDKAHAGTLFNWQSPDGSTVLATYLVDGYFNGAALGYPEQFGRFDGLQTEPELARSRAAEAIEKLSDLQKEPVYLINNGFDHMPEQPNLPEILTDINASCPETHGTRFIHGTFQQFFDEIKACKVEHYTLNGDLLGNADHPILSSVFSTRIYLKQQNHRAQSLLERFAEPLILSTSALCPSPDTAAFLEHAWKLLLQNHPHDDICGCSADGVHEDDEVRYRQVCELTESLMTEQLECLMHAGLEKPAASGVQGADVFLWNPHPWTRTTRIRSSILFANPKAESGDRTPRRELMAIDGQGRQVPITVLGSCDHCIRNNFLETSWGRRYDILIEAELPATGYQIIHVYETETLFEPQAKIEPGIAPLILKSGQTELRLQDGHYSVHFRDSAIRFKNFLKFEFQQDNGDTYTFGPVPQTETIWSDTGLAKADPHRPDSLQVHHQLVVPTGLHSNQTTTLALTTQLTLQADGSLAFETSYTNTAQNGRLRVVLPLGLLTDQVIADGHFRLAPRHKINANTPESAPERYKAYPGELEYPTQHMNDFLLAEGEHHTSWIAARGLHEFELLELGQSSFAALTLNRSVGLLSTGNGRIRRVQAGPAIAVPGAQCLREISCHYALGNVSNPGRGEAMRQARSFAHPVWVREMPWLPHLKPLGTLPRHHGTLQIDHPDIHLSSFRLSDNGETAVLRIYSTAENDLKTTIHTALPVTAMAQTGLNDNWPEDEREGIPCGSVIPLTIRPFEIATLLLKLNPAH